MTEKWSSTNIQYYFYKKKYIFIGVVENKKKWETFRILLRIILILFFFLVMIYQHVMQRNMFTDVITSEFVSLFCYSYSRFRNQFHISNK